MVFLNTNKEQTIMSQGIQLVTVLTFHILVDDTALSVPAQLPL